MRDVITPAERSIMAANPQNSLTLPSILHYLQTESSRYERDRNYWELERAEMKARIAKVRVILSRGYDKLRLT